MSAQAVVLVPVLGRPERVALTLQNLAKATEPGTYRVLFIADDDDTDELAALRQIGADWITVDEPRNYAAKINAGYRASDEPVLLTGADDLHFHPDWLPRALRWMTEGVHVVGTNDLANHRVMTGQHSTHSLVRRSYIDDPGGVIDEDRTIYHEGYPHEFCDDEFIGTAMARGVYAHAFDSLVEHLHPMVGKADDDATYRKGRAETRVGRQLFRQRRRMWQPTRSRSSVRASAGTTNYGRPSRRSSTQTGSSSPTTPTSKPRRPGR